MASPPPGTSQDTLGGGGAPNTSSEGYFSTKKIISGVLPVLSTFFSRPPPPGTPQGPVGEEEDTFIVRTQSEVSTPTTGSDDGSQGEMFLFSGFDAENLEQIEFAANAAEKKVNIFKIMSKTTLKTLHITPPFQVPGGLWKGGPRLSFP